MDVDPRLLIKGLYAARRVGDREAMLACCHDDVVFTSNVHPKYPLATARIVGITAVDEYLTMARELWEMTDKHLPHEVWGADVSFTAIVEVEMRHRRSGATFEGTKRQKWTVDNGKIRRMSQFLDEKLINAIHSYAAWPGFPDGDVVSPASQTEVASAADTLETCAR